MPPKVDVINVLSYSHTGSGTYDDPYVSTDSNEKTANIQKGCDDLKALVGTSNQKPLYGALYLPAGYYKVEKTLNFTEASPDSRLLANTNG